MRDCISTTPSEKRRTPHTYHPTPDWLIRGFAAGIFYMAISCLLASVIPDGIKLPHGSDVMLLVGLALAFVAGALSAI
jgi:hypothetical protein